MSDAISTTLLTLPVPHATLRPNPVPTLIPYARQERAITNARTYGQTYPLTHLLTYSLTHLPTYSLTHSPTHSPTHPLTHPLTYSLTYSLTHLLTYPLTHLLTYSLTHSLTYSLTHLLTYSLTNSPTPRSGTTSGGAQPTVESTYAALLHRCRRLY